jgi:beta-glucosidase
VADAAAYASCPGMVGTHLDASLGVEQRLDYLVAHVPLADQIAQLRNTAPELTAFGIPSYQWLNDDQHGVARTPARATVFPNGCALGATFSAATLHSVGRIIGEEARGASPVAGAVASRQPPLAGSHASLIAYPPPTPTTTTTTFPRVQGCTTASWTATRPAAR